MMDRQGWVQHLEAHHSRYLAMRIMDNCVGAIEAAESIHGGNYKHVLQVTCDELIRDAQEARQEIETARTMPAELLADYVRYQTLPQWRKAMQDAGFTWDVETMRWEAS